MTGTNLKAVLSFDKETSAFKSEAHNLSAQRAEEKADKLKNQGLQVRVLDQPTRHKGFNYKNCKLCKNAAENLSPQQSGDPAEEDHTEGPALPEGNGPEE
jgi:hypothetical protein